MFKSLRRWSLLPLLCLTSCLTTLVTHAQINFDFITTSGTYTNLTGGTVVWTTDQDNNLSAALPIGFTFQYASRAYTEFKVSSNGWISLGTAANNNMATNDLSTTGQGPIIAPLWDNLQVQANMLTYRTQGTAGSRILTVQFRDVRWTRTAGGAVISFQVKLYEATNNIEFIYTQGGTGVTSGSASIGLSGGSSSSDFYSVNNRDNNAEARYNDETDNQNNKPGNGRTYRWTPNNMFYSSSTTAQVSGDATKCNTQYAIMSVQITTEQSSTPMSLTQFRIDLAGTALTDLSGVHIYYTGTSSTFAATNEFNAATITPATGTITVNGTRQLANGVNYFWIAYDLHTNAVVEQTLDAACSGFTINGTSWVPAVTNPTGVRDITLCVRPGGVAGSSFWIKANQGAATTNNTKVSTWLDQSYNDRHATNSTSATQPTYYDNAARNVNYNPIVDFDEASQDKNYADFMDITANSALSAYDNYYAVYAVVVPGVNNLTSPGKFFFGGTSGANNFHSFDVRSNKSINDSWGTNDLIVQNMWGVDSVAQFTFDYNRTRRETWKAGTSTGTRTSVARSSPNSNNALGCQRSATIEYYDGGIAEIISFANASHNATLRGKVESYLAIKYGVTLGHDYLNSTGGTVWNRSSAGGGYNNNIIGIGLDKASGLEQKQSKSTTGYADILRIHIGPSLETNQANNSGTFASSDLTFLMVGHNNGVSINLGGDEKPAGIYGRLEREWFVQRSNFTNASITLVFDFNAITPGYMQLNAADLRLLVDTDGDFTNALVLNTPTITITTTPGVATVTVPASTFSARPYFTLASASSTTVLPLDIRSFTGICRNDAVQLNWSVAGEVAKSIVVERSTDRTNFSTVGIVAASGNEAYTWVDHAPVAGTLQYRLKTTDQQGAVRYSTVLNVPACNAKTIQLSTNAVTHASVLLLQLPQNGTAEINLYDLMGRRVDVPGLTGMRSFVRGVHNLPVNVPGTGTGWYTLQVVMQGERHAFRVLKR